MTTFVLGVSHRSAPMSVLDSVALSGSGVEELRRRVLGGDFVDGALVLSTCNRLEIIADVRSFHGGLSDVGSALAEVAGMDWQELARHVYVRYEDKAVEHMLTVASGLDSMAIGESQILGQLRHSYSSAQEARELTGELSQTIQDSLRVGKRAHAETSLDTVARSLLDMALVSAVDHIGDLAQADVLIVGAGAMSGLSVATLARQGVRSVTVLNRTLERAERLAATVDGRADVLTPESLAREFARASLVISVTGARGAVIDAEVVSASLHHQDAGAPPAPTFVVDLALPFDVDPDVETHDHVRMVNLEGISALFADSAHSGDGDVAAIVGQVQGIIREEVAELSARRRARQVGPTVAALRSQARETVDREFDRLARRLGDDAPQKVLDEARQAMRRVATTILHTPTVRVKELTGTDAESIDYAAALTTLFDLDRTPAAQAPATPVPTTAEAAALMAEAVPDEPLDADLDGLMAMALSPALEMTAAASTATPIAHAAPALVTAATTSATAPAATTSASGVSATTSATTTSAGSADGSAVDGTTQVADHTLDVVEPERPTGRTVRLGTRRSRLARSQSTAIAQQLAQQTGWRVEIVEVVTEGDVNMTPLASFGGTGVFVSAVRQALLTGTIDIAVHSLKDLPTAEAPGILLAAVPPRVDPADVLVARDGLTLAQLPAGAVVGTGSPRRAAQLRAARPDIEVTGVRGNVDTRIRHVREGRLDGVVLAAAGVRRLGRIDEATDVLDGDVMLPAPGQGALAVECRADDAHLSADDASLRDALRGLHDEDTAVAVHCERAILTRAEAGCSAPIGALARLDGRTLTITGVLADEQGTLLRETRSADLPDGAEAAHAAALETGHRTAIALLDGLGLAPGAAGTAHAPTTHLPAAGASTDAAGGDDRDDASR